uniref:Uncharacterized protein n=2 Tax=Canis lupus familiaris TaxID=9615 RepID=A0A8C0P359_CANLF
MPPVQKRKLDPLPKKHRHLRKEKVATDRPPILPTPLVLPPSEEDEVVDTKLMVFRAQEGDPDPPTEDVLQSQQDEGACVMHQECQIQPCELSASQEPGFSSPAVTSLASCVCQTFSRSRQQKPPRSEGAELAEVGGDAKALRRGSGQKKTECSLMRACSTLMPVRVLPVCSFVDCHSCPVSSLLPTFPEDGSHTISSS